MTEKIEIVISKIHYLVANHKFWLNPMLTKAKAENYSLDDYRYIFTQYHYYSTNFTRILATAMVKCENDYHRAKLTENLWEESGESNTDQRHSELFRLFLSKGLGLDIKKIQASQAAKQFVDSTIALCLESSPADCVAVLTFATEGIVSRLYTIFIEGLKKAGLEEENLRFFELHVECDDDHAETLQNIFEHYVDRISLDHTLMVIDKALSLRDVFFSEIDRSINYTRVEKLLNVLSSKPEIEPSFYHEKIKCTVADLDNTLYSNSINSEKINFHVDRVPFNTTNLDPRVLRVFPGGTTENHRHAHESVFYVISGCGIVKVGDSEIAVSSGSILHVPRWVSHQTINNSDKQLCIFAITDYKLSGRFPVNHENTYRYKTDDIKPLKTVEEV